MTPTFTCVVCNKYFEDGVEHLLQTKDQAHEDYEQAMSNSNYEKACICGAKPGWFGNEYSWEVRCMNCDLVWDED